jgi:hypothetical protein
MTTYDDIHYLTVNKLNIGNLDDGGNVEAAFNNWIDKAWELGAKTGNIKDLDSTQETAFKDWMRHWLTVAFEVMAQAMLRPFVPAFTESSTTTTTASALAIWKQADWDAFIASLEKLDCPDFVYRFCEPFQWYIKMSEGYEKAGLPIPPSFYIPVEYKHHLSDLQGHRESAKAVSAQAMTHCKKFGIPFSKFSMSKLTAKELNRKGLFENPDIVAFFSAITYSEYDNDPATFVVPPISGQFSGADLTDDYTGQKYAFIDGKPMSVLHSLKQFFYGTYNATNAPYANIFTGEDPDTNEYEVSLRHTSMLGTSWTNGTISSLGSLYILEMYMSFYNVGASLGMAYTGTKVTADQTYDVEHWIALRENPDICIGTGVAGEEVLDSAQNVARYMIYGD